MGGDDSLADKGHKGTFRSDKNSQYLDRGGG